MQAKIYMSQYQQTKIIAFSQYSTFQTTHLSISENKAYMMI